MGYLFLAIALLAGSTKGFCGKKASGYIKGFRSTILASTLRMVLCAAVGFVLVLVGNGPSAFAAPGKLYLVSALYGLSMASMVVLWLIIVKKSVYTLLNIFAMMGLLIPLITTRILFGEPIDPIQCLGLCVLFSAVLIMCSYNNSVKGKLTLPVLGLLISYGTVCGLCDLSSKLFVKFVPNTPTVVFNFYTYLFAAIVLIIASFITRSPSGNLKEELSELKKPLGYIAVMAAALFINSYFKTLAAARLDSILLYPLNQGGGLILAATMSSVVFREKLTWKAGIGLATAFLGLMMINVL